MRYEIATLTIRIGAAAQVTAGIAEWAAAPECHATLLGCWTTELGDLNQVLVLRSFADDAALHAERWRLYATSNPFGCGEAIKEMVFDSYAPFPFLPPVTPGRYGAMYEIRTYRLNHGGVAATIAAWEKAVPARVALSPLVIAMYTLDGAPRFTHIWPYESLNHRAAIRAESIAQGIWPPKGGVEWLMSMRSVIGIPAAISPLG